MEYFRRLAPILFLLYGSSAYSQKTKPVNKSGNPVFPGWYADPEAHIFDNTYWIYPTYSDDYKDVPSGRGSLSESQKEMQKNTINKSYLKQTFLDAFSSKDMVHWTKHPHVLDIKNVSWAAYSVWAP